MKGQPTQPAPEAMKVVSQSRESRSEVIWRYVSRMIHERRITQETYTQNVVEHYHRIVPLEARRTEFSVGGDPFRCATSNAQLLFRFESLTRHGLPLDLEEPCLLAMAEPYQSDCRRELAYRIGVLDVPLPDLSRVTDAQSLANVMRDFAPVIAEMSAVMSDGRVTQADVPHLDSAITHVLTLIGSSEGLLALLEEHKKNLARAAAKSA